MSISFDWGYVVTTAQLVVVVVLTSRTIHSFAIEMENAVLIAAIMRCYSPFPLSRGTQTSRGEMSTLAQLCDWNRMLRVGRILQAINGRPNYPDGGCWLVRFRTIWPIEAEGWADFLATELEKVKVGSRLLASWKSGQHLSYC